MTTAVVHASRRVAFVLNFSFALVLIVYSIIEGIRPSLAHAGNLPVTRASAGANVGLAGQLEILHEDFAHSGRYLYFLKTSKRRIPLHFRKNPPTNLLTGDYVGVRGTQLRDGSLLLESGTGRNVFARSKNPPPSGPLPNTFGPQSTLVILVNFQDDAVQPYTVADAQTAFFTAANSFFQESSYGQTSLTGNVVGWYTIPDSVTTCNTTQIATDAQNAAVAAGANLSNYTRYVYAFPSNAACGFAGASNVGGNPSQSWINGTDGSGSLDLHTIDHELGHAFGLWHSHLLDCGATATIGTNCTPWEYGDILDTMGAVQPATPHFNAFQKERLGWLNYGASPSITNVSAAGTYAVGAYELAGAGPNALKILKSVDPTTGAKTWYYLEARQALGFDSFLTDGSCSSCYTQNETSGLLFHIGTEGAASSGYLIDMTPATPAYYWWFDPSLSVGQTFADPAAGVSVTTDWVTSSAAAVDIQFTGAVSVATNQTIYSPGTTVYTTATATYAGLPASNVSVNFTILKANGNVVTGSANTGGNGVASYKLKLSSTDPAGNYLAAAAATIKGNPHTASVNFTVQ